MANLTGIQTDIISQRFTGIVFIIAPLLFSGSTFFWRNGEYGVIGGTLLIISMVFWVPVFYGLFGLIKNQLPLYYHIGLIVAIYGTVVGGTGFGYLGYFSAIFDISHKTYIQNLE